MNIYQSTQSHLSSIHDKQYIAVLYYYKEKIGTSCLQEQIISNTKRISSFLGFHITFQFFSNLYKGFIYRTDDKATIYFISHLDLYIKTPADKNLFFSSSLKYENKFSKIEKNLFSIYFEQSFSQKKQQILFLPAINGIQYIDFFVDHKEKPIWKEINSFKIRWYFGNQFFDKNTRIALSSIYLSHLSQATVNYKPLSTSVFFRDGVMKNISEQIKHKKKPKKKHRHFIFHVQMKYNKKITSHASCVETDITKFLRVSYYKQREKFDTLILNIENQRIWGDWLELGKKLPIYKLNKIIKSYNLRVGISFPPFLAHSKSKIVKDHPELFLKKERKFISVAVGKNSFFAKKTLYVFDLTHPNYFLWISQVIKTIVKDWNFTFFDFTFFNPIYSTLGTRYDSSKSSVEYLNNVIKIIKRTAGKKVTIHIPEEKSWPSIHLIDGIKKKTGYIKRNFWENNTTLFIRSLKKELSRLAYLLPIQNHFPLFSTEATLTLLQNFPKLNQRQKYLLLSIIALFGGHLYIQIDYNSNTVIRDVYNDPDFQKMLLIHEKYKNQSLQFLFKSNTNSYRKTENRDPTPVGVGIYQKSMCMVIWNIDTKPKLIDISLPTDINLMPFQKGRDYWTDQYIPWYCQKNRIQIGLAPFECFLVTPS